MNKTMATYIVFCLVVLILSIPMFMGLIESFNEKDFGFTLFFAIGITILFFLLINTYMDIKYEEDKKQNKAYTQVEAVELNGKKYIKDVNGNYVLIKEPTQQDIEQNGVKTTILAKVFKDEKYIESENGNYITIEKGEKIK